MKRAGMPDSFENWSTLAQNIYFWLGTLIVPPIIFLVRHVRRLRSASKCKTLLDYVSSIFPDERNAAPLVVRALSCVVVDDKPDDFPVDFMRGFFKSAEVRSSVSLSEARKLAAYDFIFLDVAGVVREDLEFGGATLIDDIRREGCRNTIISVSSKKYDLRVAEYFSSADIRIRKPLRVEDIRQQVLTHIEKKIGPHALARKIDAEFTRLHGARRLGKLARSFANGSVGEYCVEVKRAAVEKECEALRDIMARMD